MRRLFPVLVVVLGLGATFLASLASADEIKQSDVPKKVLSVVKAKYPGAKLVAFFKDGKDTEVFFSVVLKHKNDDYEVVLNPQGDILEIAKVLDPKDLPPAIVQAVHKKYPKAKIEDAAEVTDPGQKVSRTFHVAASLSDGRVVEIVLDPSGKILHEEFKKATNP